MPTLCRLPEWTGKLVEGNLGTHYRRYYPTFYIKAEGEVDLAYIDRNRFHPVEVKWTGQARGSIIMIVMRKYFYHYKTLPHELQRAPPAHNPRIDGIFNIALTSLRLGTTFAEMQTS